MICYSCKVDKSLTEFGNNRVYANGKHIWCKTCWNKRAVANYKKQTLAWRIFYNLAYRARYTVTFNRDEFYVWYKDTPKVCVYCGISAEESERQLGKRLQLDRKNSFLGYSLSNVVLACWRCNTGKSNIFTYQEWKEIGSKYVRPKWEEKINACERTGCKTSGVTGIGSSTGKVG